MSNINTLCVKMLGKSVRPCYLCQLSMLDGGNLKLLDKVPRHLLQQLFGSSGKQ